MFGQYFNCLCFAGCVTSIIIFGLLFTTDTLVLLLCLTIVWRGTLSKMSEWLPSNAKWKDLSRYMMMRTSYISMRLWCCPLWNYIPQTDMSLHCVASSRTHQSLLLKMVYLVEGKQILILVFVLTRPRNQNLLHSKLWH